MNMREFGVRLTRARQERRLSTAELARQLGVDYMSVSRYEKGQSLPSFATAIRLASLLQVSLDVLASGVEIPEPPPAFKNRKLLARMRALDELPAERQELALVVLDAVMAGELDGLVNRLRG